MKTLRTLTFDEAWDICELAGKAAPYLGYAVEVGNGRFVRRIAVPGQDNKRKGQYELCEPSE